MATFSYEEEKIATKLNLGVWRKIFVYAMQRWYLFIMLIVMMLITSFHDASFIPLLNKAAIEAIGTNIGVPLADVTLNVTLIFGIRFSITFWQYALLLGIGILIRSIAIFFTFFFTNYIEMSIYVKMRQDAFKRVQELSFSYYDKTSSGWLIARLQSDTSKISDMISWGLIIILWLSFELILTIITMFTVSWQMALILLATTPIIAIIAPYFEIAILKLSRIARNAYSGYVAWLAETIAGVKTIKTLAIENNVNKDADDIVTDIKNKNFKTAKVQAFFFPSVLVISALATALVIFVGTIFLQNEQTFLTIAVFVLFIGFVRSLYIPLQEFADLFGTIMATQSSVEKIVALIETKLEIVDHPEVIEKYGDIFNKKIENFEPMKGSIHFKNIKFSYLPGVEVIKDISMKINKGETVAIVGETGSGKSTIVSLLCRFYQPTSGEILIDGVEYRKRSLGWLRHHIGLVQQTPFIFSGTIKDNIRYGKLDATDEEIIKAANVVDAHKFISSLPNGYDTVLKDGGSDLSVGQKQLISFARAIVRNPSLMILDEATSSIDTETEAVIQKAIATVLKGRTSIIIAHRLSTIVNADRIIVLKDGKIIEQGTHKQLMLTKGQYYKLYMNQFAELRLEEQIKTYEKQLSVS
jgi:ATP-binding cassette, subfamily B, bacterial